MADHGYLPQRPSCPKGYWVPPFLTLLMFFSEAKLSFPFILVLLFSAPSARPMCTLLIWEAWVSKSNP